MVGSGLRTFCCHSSVRSASDNSSSESNKNRRSRQKDDCGPGLSISGNIVQGNKEDQGERLEARCGKGVSCSKGKAPQRGRSRLRWGDNHEHGAVSSSIPQQLDQRILAAIPENQP